MKKIYSFIVFGIILISLNSCEEVVNDVSLPYVENLVIRGILESGKEIQIDITKTIPPLEEMTEEKIRVDSAIVYVTIDGEKIECFKNSKGLYSNPRIVEAGKKYFLEVNWKNKKAFAETAVPPLTPILSYYKIVKKSSSWDDYNISYYIKILADKNYSYLPMIEQYYLNRPNGLYYQWDNIYYLTPKDGNKVPLEMLVVNMYSSDSSYFEKIKDFKFKFRLDTYDKAFVDYYLTKYNGESSSLFGMSGTNVIWNIKGDGIGLFIGKSSYYLDLK